MSAIQAIRENPYMSGAVVSGVSGIATVVAGALLYGIGGKQLASLKTWGFGVMGAGGVGLASSVAFLFAHGVKQRVEKDGQN